jgi:hypothetical protein
MLDSRSPLPSQRRDWTLRLAQVLSLCGYVFIGGAFVLVIWLVG